MKHINSLKIMIIILGLFLTIFFSCDGGGDSDDQSEFQESDDDDSIADDDDDSSDDDDDDSSDDDDDGSSWTMIVYMAADNDLFSFANDDLTEMAAVGSTDRVNVIVIFDGNAQGDSNYYKVEKDGLVGLKNPGEFNMGDPETLINGVTWSMENYPADKYMLIIWDHGSGWHKGQKSPTHKSICQDVGSGDDWLEPEELDDALGDSRNQSGVSKFDILAFDACLMQMMEVGYFIRDDAKIMVGSEEIVSTTGYDYVSILEKMTSNPGMTPKSLAAKMVDSFIAIPDAQLSAVDLNKMDQLAGAVDDFALSLIDVGGLGNDKVENALYQTLYFDDFDYIDLYHFAKMIESKNINSLINQSSGQVMDAFDNSIIANGYGRIEYKEAGGLSIYFPDPSNSYFDSAYLNLDFAKDTSWDDLIEF